VNGQPAPIGRAQFTFIGVELPEGARTVELNFASGTYATGRLVTLLALSGFAVWLVAAVVLGRRRRRDVG
jgi:uncharacterized membrane protein YfhO